MKKLFQNNAFVFLLIVAISVAYKTLFLDYSGLWHDEAFNLYFSQQHWGHLKHISEWNCNPPLYYYFIWIWENLFGIGEYAARLSSVLFSSVSAGLIYLFCARYFTKGSGWIAVLFYAVGNEMFFFSHEVRPHALVVFLVLCSSLIFFELMRKPGWGWAIVLGTVNFGILYLNYASSLVVILQILVLVFYREKRFLKFFAAAFGISILFAALRFTPKTLTLLFARASDVSTPQIGQLPGMWYRFFNGPDLFFVFLFAAIAVMVHLVRNKEWRPLFLLQRPMLIYVMLMGFGASILFFFLGYLSTVFMSDIVIFAAPFIYITLAWFLEKADANIRYPLLALVSIFVFFSFLRIDFRTPKQMDYRGAVELVKSLQRNGGTTLVETRDVGALFAYYYDRNAFSEYDKMEERLKEKKIFLVNKVEEAQWANASNANQVILTQTFQQFNADNAALENYLSENFRTRVSTGFYRGVTITLYSK